MEDQEIIELYWEREERAITETADKYGEQLFYIGKNILEDRKDAKECTNDTYQAAWTTLPPKRPEYFFAYLAKIMRHFAFGILDYKKAQKRSAVIVELSEELENCIPDPDDHEKRMESEEIGKAISAFLKTKPETMRKVFVRRYWYMDSIKEIAQWMHMSESKVKSILFRMRKSLRKHLESEGIVL